MPDKQTNADKIISIARRWLNTPYKHQGRSRRGCDCVGLPLALARELGIEVEDYRRYGRLPVSAMLVEKCRAYCTEIPRHHFAPGDLVLMTWGKDRDHPHHFAIVTRMAGGETGIIHSHSRVGRVVEHRLDAKWRRRITHAFRIPAGPSGGPH